MIPETITDLELMMQEARMGQGLAPDGEGDLSASSFPMGAISRTGPGYITLYRVADGERVDLPTDFIRVSLDKTDEQGNPIFTRVKPDYIPKLGTFRCPLHVKEPNHAEYAEFGYPSCNKSTLRSQAQVGMHMRTKHPAIWDDLERGRLEAERKETLELQHAVLRAQGGGAPTPMNPSPPMNPIVPALTTPPTVEIPSVVCGCGGSYRPKGRTFHERSHAHQNWATKSLEEQGS